MCIADLVAEATGQFWPFGLVKRRRVCVRARSLLGKSLHLCVFSRLAVDYFRFHIYLREMRYFTKTLHRANIESAEGDYGLGLHKNIKKSGPESFIKMQVLWKPVLSFHFSCAMTHNPQLIWFAVIARQGKKVDQGQLLTGTRVLDRAAFFYTVGHHI